jgi:hypothetical protein
LKGKPVNEETKAEALRLILKEATPLSLVGASALVRRHTIEAMFEALVERISRN